MRAIRDCNGLTTFINRDETRLFHKIDMEKFVALNTLTEREHYLAEELYKRNVLQKVDKESTIGYKVYPQTNKL